MKIGLLFGSFDPLTNAHTSLAFKALDELDQVWIVLSPQSPYKAHKKQTNELHRKEMISKYLREEAQDKKLMLCPIELISKERPNYTYKTIEKITRMAPNNKFYLVCGRDVLQKLMVWKKSDYVFEMLDGIVCSGRKGFKYTDPPEHVMNMTIFVDIDKHGISSTVARKRLGDGKDVSGLLPKSIIRYNETHRIYETDNNIKQS